MDMRPFLYLPSCQTDVSVEDTRHETALDPAWICTGQTHTRGGTLLVRCVGTALLHAIMDHARAAGMSSVRLDVIDTNPTARALYERLGFTAKGTRSLGPMRVLFGFSHATEMHKAL